MIKGMSKDSLNIVEWERLYYSIAIDRYYTVQERIDVLGCSRRTYFRRILDLGLQSQHDGATYKVNTNK